MTNAEWIKTLSEEKLAIVITQLRELYPIVVYGYNDSKLGVALWMKQEHKPELDRIIKNGADYIREMLKRSGK